ncbi:MAG: biotin-dependent carboxyltransferase family protein [Granulosicoccus sp.]
MIGSNQTSLDVVSSGLLSTIQDKGRFGLRHLGIPWSGALCPAWQIIANALVGNSPNSPVIECFEGGLHLQAHEQSVQLAIVGSDSAAIKLISGTTEYRYLPNRTLTLGPGDSLVLVSTGSSRHALVAVAGIDIAPHLGSTATYHKASLGGLDGSALKAGEQIPLQRASAEKATPNKERQCHLPTELRFEANELRAIAGPQFEHFSDAGTKAFLSSSYTLGAEADRMGVRLSGPTITHRDSAARDIISDAITPGSIQVPGTGQPIVLLNDAHTAGGYPKIATVISNDLPLLGIQRAGAVFQFRLVTMDEAILIRQKLQNLIENCTSAFTPCIRDELDTRTLLSCNLIDGVTDGF